MRIMLDVSPVTLGAGILFLIAAVLTLVALLIGAFVFLLKWLKRCSSPTVREGALPSNKNRDLH